MLMINNLLLQSILRDTSSQVLSSSLCFYIPCSFAGRRMSGSKPFSRPEHIDPGYNVRSVTHLSQLQPGDHVKENRGFYDHHLLVVKPVSDTEAHVIHYSEGDEGAHVRFTFPPTRPELGLIAENTSYEMDPKTVSILTIKTPPENLFPIEEAFERARTRIGEKRWHLFKNNCEHFVNWALTGEALSFQANAVKRIGEDFRTGARTGRALNLGAVAVGAGKLVASYAQYRKDVNTTEKGQREDGVIKRLIRELPTHKLIEDKIASSEESERADAEEPNKKESTNTTTIQ